MKRFSLAALLVAGLLVGCGGQSGESTTAIPFDSARAMKDVEALAKTIGPRPAGSDGAKRAVDYIANEFSVARFGVLRTDFTFETDPNRPATVTAGGTSFEAITAGGSKDGTVSAPAAALPAAIAQGALAGKVAVAVRGGASFQEKYDIAWASGAVGLVIVNSESGTVTANLGQPASFPVVTIAGSANAQMQAAAASGAVVTVTVSPPELAQGANITARSRSAHACTYVVVANYDSLPGSPGAEDNATGVAVMLELARQFDATNPIPEVCFVALDARFAGGAGAKRFLDGLTASGRPAVVISIARLGVGEDMTAYGELTLKSRLNELADDQDVKIKDGGSVPPAAGNSDLFRAAGISSIEIAREGGPIGRADVFSKVSEKRLGEAGRLIGALAKAVSATSVP